MVDQIDGEIVFPHLVRDHTQEVQGNGLIRIAPEYLLVDAFRLRPTALVVMLYGKVYGLLYG